MGDCQSRQNHLSAVSQRDSHGGKIIASSTAVKSEPPRPKDRMVPLRSVPKKPGMTTIGESGTAGSGCGYCSGAGVSGRSTRAALGIHRLSTNRRKTRYNVRVTLDRIYYIYNTLHIILEGIYSGDLPTPREEECHLMCSPLQQTIRRSVFSAAAV
jgi:hypothetical protein